MGVIYFFIAIGRVIFHVRKEQGRRANGEFGPGGPKAGTIPPQAQAMLPAGPIDKYGPSKKAKNSPVASSEADKYGPSKVLPAQPAAVVPVETPAPITATPTPARRVRPKYKQTQYTRTATGYRAGVVEEEESTNIDVGAAWARYQAEHPERVWTYRSAPEGQAPQDPDTATDSPAN